MSRIIRRLTVLVVVGAAMLAWASPAWAAFPGENGKLAFASDRDGNREIYSMNADGTGQTRLTNNSSTDSQPDWQPINPDLSVLASDRPDPVKVGQNLTYSFAIANNGRLGANNVSLTARLPEGVEFVSASPGCTNTGSTVRCELGDLATGASTPVEVTVRPTAEGTITTTVTVASSVRDADATDNTDRETAQVTQNRAPVANGDAYSINEDATLTVPASGGVLSDDTDPDGDPLTAVLVSGPTDGALTLNPNGSFTYKSNKDFNGVDSFEYKANDGSTDSAPAVVLIRVRAVNDAPLATNDAATIEKDVAKGIAVLSNDKDVDGDALKVSRVTDPPHGTAAINVSGTAVLYAPDAGYVGPDSFAYTISDGQGGTDTATVSVAVKDTIKPTVATVRPANGAKNVAPLAKVTATFSEAMRASTLNRTTFTLTKKGTTKKIAATVSYSASTKKAILNPSRPLVRGATYTVKITTGAKDAAGNALARSKVWIFTVRR